MRYFADISISLLFALPLGVIVLSIVSGLYMDKRRASAISIAAGLAGGFVSGYFLPPLSAAIFAVMFSAFVVFQNTKGWLIRIIGTLNGSLFAGLTGWFVSFVGTNSDLISFLLYSALFTISIEYLVYFFRKRYLRQFSHY